MDCKMFPEKAAHDNLVGCNMLPEFQTNLRFPYAMSKVRCLILRSSVSHTSGPVRGMVASLQSGGMIFIHTDLSAHWWWR
ncbi:hypothetical protein UPYG_G00278630 [Umbra pygmaea]|uniref:Uncharacterized protein n=1 Tax=Umbra pygmaea TaxID=75934 RepID=A0ABD0WNK8_UMBPY